MNGKLRNMTSIYLLDDNNRVLLLYRMGSRVIKDSYTGSAGGHFENNELNDAKACVLRELNEETGLTEQDISNLELRYITLRYGKGEIRQNYYFFAKLNNTEQKINSIEGNIAWFDINKAVSLDMPYTAKYVFKHYVDKGRLNNKLYGGIATEDGVEFVELKEF